MFKVSMVVAQVSFWVGIRVDKWISCVKQTRAIGFSLQLFYPTQSNLESSLRNTFCRTVQPSIPLVLKSMDSFDVH
jgi:hypothetical protein